MEHKITVVFSALNLHQLLRAFLKDFAFIVSYIVVVLFEDFFLPSDASSLRNVYAKETYITNDF